MIASFLSRSTKIYPSYTRLSDLIMKSFPTKFKECYFDGVTYVLHEVDDWIWYPQNPRQLWNVANRLGKERKAV